MFEFGNLVNGAIEFVLETIIDGLFSIMGGWMANLSASAAIILDMPIVNNMIVYTQGLAGALLIIKVAFEALTTYILQQSGDSDADPGGLLIRTGQAVFVIAAVPWLVKNIYLIGSLVAYDVSRLDTVEYIDARTPLEALWNGLNVAEAMIPFAIGIIFGIIMLLIVVIQSFIRAGELAVLAGSGSLMALSLSGTNNGWFSTWWKELLVLSSTQAIQIFLVKLAFGALMLSTTSNIGNYNTTNPFVSLILFIAILWVTIKAPSSLRSFIHSSGTGRVAGQVGNMVMMRKLMTRGK